MNRNKLKTYAPEARRDFIEAVTARAAQYGLTAKKIEPMTVEGDVAMIAGKPYSKAVGEKRKKLEARINRDGFEQTMEAMAYTWFNRLVAIRFMELHEYLDHGYRVLSHPQGHSLPEIVEHAEHVDLPGLDKKKVIELKLDGTKEDELYRMLLIGQCNALSKAMPFLFESIDDETELLLPDHLLHSDSLIRNLVNEIPEEDWQEVEIIGWLYQFYISEKKDEVIGKVVKSEDIPAATQLFTPNWIVKYLVQNSLGRQWMATYPDSPLTKKPEQEDDQRYWMEYYIEPAEQTPEVEAKLAEITPDSLNPEELTLLDPACGSGHILVEAYDLLKAIFQERGYRAKDIPRLILEKNLYGLEIDDRAAQLAAFALMMKARADDRNIFERDVQPHVLSIQDSNGLDAADITEALNAPLPDGSTGDISQADVAHLIELFEDGKMLGSLIQVPSSVAEMLPSIHGRLVDVVTRGEMLDRSIARLFQPLVAQASLVARRYSSIAMNPPYMGNFFAELKRYADKTFPDSKADLFSMFIERGIAFGTPHSRIAMITMHAWMFLSSFEKLREKVLHRNTIESLAHLGARAFGTISGEIVQTVAFVVNGSHFSGFHPTCFRLVDGDEKSKRHGLRTRENKHTESTQDDFAAIPGSPIAYWADPALLQSFSTFSPLSTVAKVVKGLVTLDNNRFLRLWQEVSLDNTCFDATNAKTAEESCAKWFPYNKGGGFRRWFGFQEYLINWQDDGKELKEFISERYNGQSYTKEIRNEDCYFRAGITWSSMGTEEISLRKFGCGFLFDSKGCCAFPNASNATNRILGVLNSRVVSAFLEFMSPTVDFNPGTLAKVPIPDLSALQELDTLVEEAVRISTEDWNSYETSWCFHTNPLVERKQNTAAEAWQSHKLSKSSAFDRLLETEQSINDVCISAYHMSDGLSGDVSRDEITIQLPKIDEECRNLVAYAIGCMMGRFSLDEPGLIYAHNGNQGFDPSKYNTFPADDDGIVPLTEFHWFEDDAARRFEKFVATAWSKEHLEENLEFVAESLGQKRGESSRDTIRRYLAVDFFKDHLLLYKRRPIYWLFSSGKQRGFQALVYLHRYNEGTLARMRTEYVIPLLGKMTARIDHLTDDIASASSSQHQKRLEKEKATIVKQLAEVQEFDEKLRHYADQRISLNLDDGVKVNYGKFGTLLAEVKKVTGKKAED